MPVKQSFIGGLARAAAKAVTPLASRAATSLGKAVQPALTAAKAVPPMVSRAATSLGKAMNHDLSAGRPGLVPALRWATGGNTPTLKNLAINGAINTVAAPFKATDLAGRGTAAVAKRLVKPVLATGAAGAAYEGVTGRRADFDLVHGAGDLLRRTPLAQPLLQRVTNNIIPFGYGHSVSDMAKNLKQPTPGSQIEHGAFGLRRELMQRSFGVPITEPSPSFREVGEQPFAAGASQGVPSGRYRTVELTPDGAKKLYDYDRQRLRANGVDALGTVLGSHGLQPQPDGSREVTDLWDFALSQREQQQPYVYSLKYPQHYASDLMRNFAQGLMPPTADGGRGVVYRQRFTNDGPDSVKPVYSP